MANHTFSPLKNRWFARADTSNVWLWHQFALPSNKNACDHVVIINIYSLRIIFFSASNIIEALEFFVYAAAHVSCTATYSSRMQTLCEFILQIVLPCVCFCFIHNFFSSSRWKSVSIDFFPVRSLCIPFIFGLDFFFALSAVSFVNAIILFI